MPEPIYRLAVDVQWAVRQKGVVVFLGSGGPAWHFDYPQAAVWDLLTRGYRHPRMVRLLCAIAALDEEGAERLLRESVEQWHEAGLLVPDGGHD